MGWASGSQLAEDVWDLVRHYIPPGELRAKTARRIVDLFERMDCDTIDEAQHLCEDAGRIHVLDEIKYVPEYPCSPCRWERGCETCPYGANRPPTDIHFEIPIDIPTPLRDVMYRVYRNALGLGPESK
jgi:hypothetical protein